MEALWLSRKDVESLKIPMIEVLDAVEEGFKLNGLGKSELPAKIGVHPRKDCFIHAMPCWVGGDVDTVGIKWAAGYPPNQAKGLPYINGVWCMNDPDTGMIKSVMDANWMTAWRTGAASGVCARYLASPDSGVVSMIGLGVQARTNLAALKEALDDIREVRIYDVFPEQAKRFLAEMAPLLPKADFVTESTVESAVKGADVVVTCTPIVEHPERFVRREWMKDNVLCIAVDYDSAFCKEVMMGKVFVCDNRNQYLWTQAQGVYFQNGYPVESEIYADMGELCAGKAAPVREGLRGAVLMGIASHDVMTGRLIYRKAIENKVGTWVEL